MGSGDGCTIMGMYIVPWNYTLKNGSNGKLSHSSGERMSNPVSIIFNTPVLIFLSQICKFNPDMCQFLSPSAS